LLTLFACGGGASGGRGEGRDAGAPLNASAAAPPAPDAAPVARRAIAKHVIVLSEDGLRPDAIVRARAPAHDRIMREGSWSLKARTIRQASTLASHAAMLSGFDVGAHGLHWNSWRPERGFIRVPTIFTAAEGEHTAAFVGKQKLAHITGPRGVDFFARPGFFCKKVVEQAATYFVEHRPTIEFVHFSDPDERGHAIGWMSDAQLEAIHAVDKCLARLLQAVADSGAAADTLLILSADHGGHGRNHSGGREEDRLIPWIAWGAGVRQNHRLSRPISTVDTAATVLWALGLPPPPGLAGKPVVEAFEAGAAAPPPD
jgi:hypothetical protein